MDDDGALPSPLYSESHQRQTASWLGTLPLIELFLKQLSTASLLRRKRISNPGCDWLRPVGAHSARTKKVGATSNKRLDDGDENNEGGDDSEEGDNSDEQNQQPSKRPRTDGETVNPEMLGFYRRKTHTLGKEERASPRAHVARPMMGVSYLSTIGKSGLDNDLFFIWISPHGHDDFRDERVRSIVNLDLAEPSSLPQQDGMV
ncbi:hypothetical protein FPSE_00256 [Fusarium pseudograminearum CS3096]|uniref:Uncharacterized protein n=1 Tax=Fusarium pseudograminearum (strain CS3096) TaxID=1028729 RepID=K3V2Q4_FUSPC|nr:hypothetical protein FPSE_00256 [Fusarium pseudograminearum CS3096]EKJ79571.1 hypothetical protein FPSE_00256 [Fusarium pseudograminearum CS3096]